MLKKLKRKFIIINMSLVGIVLLVVFTCLWISNYQGMQSEMENSMHFVLNQWDSDKMGRPQIGGPGGNGPRPNFVAVFSVLADKDGNLLKTYQYTASMSDDVLKTAISKALSASGDQGSLNDMGLLYMKKTTSEGIKIAFADTSYLRDSMRRQTLISLLVILCSMTAFFFISLFLARWALRPVEKAWLQQRQFVADASHELKTPLTVILANNNILLAHTEDTVGRQKKWVESTQDEAQHMRNLVDELLFLAKSDAAETVPQVFSQVDLSELAWNLMLQFEPVAYEKGVQLDSDIESGISLIGDPTMMKQLIHILLDNGCKYAGENGRVFLRLSRQQNDILLQVRNTGPEIPPEELPHIFERFYRSDKARSREGGFGLGLAIAKSITDSHHGEIGAVREGEETVFTVRLPKGK